VERGELGRFNGWVSLLFTLTRVALIGASTIMIGLGVRNVMVGFALIQAALTLLYTLALLRVSAAKKLFLLEPSWID